ncbi:MAG: hypothetical protein P8144_13970, partial [Gammaproteobacteria bacterium]
MLNRNVLYLLSRAWGLLCTVLCVSCGGGLGGDNQAPDTVVASVPIAYVKHVIPQGDPGDTSRFMGADLRNPYEFHPGASLWLRDAASPSAAERNITAELFPVDSQTEAAPLYDVRDVSVAAVQGGLKLLFSAHAPTIEGADQQPTWNIYIYDVETRTVTRMLKSDVVAEARRPAAPALAGVDVEERARHHDDLTVERRL